MSDENNTSEELSLDTTEQAIGQATDLDFAQAAEAALAEADANPADVPKADTASFEEDAAAAAEASTGTPDEVDPAAAAAAAALGDTEELDAEATHKKRLREYTRELKKLPGQWYIIQCYSGYENKVKTNLDMRAQTLEVEDSIYDVVVPIEQVVEIKDGKKKLVKRKLLPGYVLVRMDINDRSWSVVRDTPGVTSFVGNEGNATPVKHRDVAKFLMPAESGAAGEAAAVNAEGEKLVAMQDEQSKPKNRIDFEVGEAVTILTGALASVSATISAIDPDSGKIQALVSIFGRETPVELTADQVEKLT